MFGIGLMELLIVPVMLLVVIFPFWKIFEKAGFSPWLGLLMLIPTVNIILLFYLALADWPALCRANAVSSGQTSYNP